MSAKAVMKPDPLPDSVLRDPKLSAERKVYDALRHSKSLAGAVIYHSSRWHAQIGGIARDGEADFLVAHPDWGVLSIEVKGGRIGYDAQTDSWTSTDRNDVVHAISDPFGQAAKSKRAVLGFLRDHWVGRMPFINVRHGVVFPDSEDAGRLGHLPAYAPPEIIACGDHMSKLGSRIAQMMIYDRGDRRTAPSPFGPSGMKLLDQFRGRDVDLGPLPATRVTTVDRRIVELTALQTRYLHLLRRQPVAVVEGGAGTGKTMLAMEQATRWASEKRSVLLLCFNDPLAKALAGALEDTTVAVSTFHAFCMRTASAHGVDIASEKRSYPRSWMDRLPGHLEDVALDGPDKLYDAILVDETQDFRSGWIETLRFFLKDEAESAFWCFRDDAQNVQFGDSLLDVLDTHPFALHENVRNSKPIFDASHPLRDGPRQMCLGPEGPAVERVKATPASLHKTLLRALNRLITGDRLPLEQIAVLVETSAEAVALRRDLATRNPVQADAAWSDGLVVDTVRRFKGLDRPVIILASDGTNRSLDYVGYTRARGRLVIVDTSTTADD